MAKQIKDYRLLKVSDESTSSQDLEPTIIVPDFKALFIEPLNPQPFVGYEPVEDRDLFFMIQSLYEKYANQNTHNKVQLIYAFAHLARGKWDVIEKALDKGEWVAAFSSKSVQSV